MLFYDHIGTVGAGAIGNLQGDQSDKIQDGFIYYPQTTSNSRTRKMLYLKFLVFFFVQNDKKTIQHLLWQIVHILVSKKP